MNRIESGFSERVGARISPELKAYLRELVDADIFDSEADAVREALNAGVRVFMITGDAAATDDAESNGFHLIFLECEALANQTGSQECRRPGNGTPVLMKSRERISCHCADFVSSWFHAFVAS